jgi:hypothetical protein
MDIELPYTNLWLVEGLDEGLSVEPVTGDLRLAT